MDNYVLIGFMGSGKTTIGRALAEELHLQHQDLDDLIVEEAGKPVTQIFREEGEQGFRKRETGLLQRLILSGEEGIVYSTGGGIVLEKENRKLLHQLGTVVLLDVTGKEVIRRLGEDSTRPLLQGPNREKRIYTLMSRRKSAYEESRDVTVFVDGKTPEEIVAEIQKKTAKPRILVINGPNLNFLGIREKDIYGTQDYQYLINLIQEHAGKIGVEAECWQSNHEGAIIDRLQEAYYDERLIGVVINPGAYTHYSYAIHDALKSVFVPKVEIHISDINAREEFRKVSVTAPACDLQIAGHGLQGYLEAMDYILERKSSKASPQGD